MSLSQKEHLFGSSLQSISRVILSEYRSNRITFLIFIYHNWVGSLSTSLSCDFSATEVLFEKIILIGRAFNILKLLKTLWRTFWVGYFDFKLAFVLNDHWLSTSRGCLYLSKRSRRDWFRLDRHQIPAILLWLYSSSGGYCKNLLSSVFRWSAYLTEASLSTEFDLLRWTSH